MGRPIPLGPVRADEAPWDHQRELSCSQCGDRFLREDAIWHCIGRQVDMEHDPEYHIFYRREDDFFYACRCLRCENRKLREEMEELQNNIGELIGRLNSFGIRNPLALRERAEAINERKGGGKGYY